MKVSHLFEKPITSDSIHRDNQSTMFSSTINPPLVRSADRNSERTVIYISDGEKQNV